MVWEVLSFFWQKTGVAGWIWDLRRLTTVHIKGAASPELEVSLTLKNTLFVCFFPRHDKKSMMQAILSQLSSDWPSDNSVHPSSSSSSSPSPASRPASSPAPSPAQSCHDNNDIHHDQHHRHYHHNHHSTAIILC